MSIIKLKDISMTTHGNLPEVGAKAPNFLSTNADLSIFNLAEHKGKPVLINVYPSIDTKVCFSSAKKFAEDDKLVKDGLILCISMDSPFALRRILQEESFKDVIFLSDIKNRDFGERYGLTIADGPLAGLLARAVIVLDADHIVTYTQLVSDVSMAPDYIKASQCMYDQMK